MGGRGGVKKKVGERTFEAVDQYQGRIFGGGMPGMRTFLKFSDTPKEQLKNVVHEQAIKKICSHCFFKVVT